MTKRIVLFAVLLAGCGGKYKAPPAVPSIALPSGAALRPYDPTQPGLSRPEGMALYNGNAYVTLANYDASYAIRGPGLLAQVVPSTGAVQVIDLGGSGGKQCQNPGFVRAAGSALYVTCGGDYNATPETGTAVVVINPANNTVTHTVATPVAPSGVAVAASRIWFGDSTSGNVYAIDPGSFAIVAGPIAIQCPAQGYTTVNDLAVVGGDLFALCSNQNGGTLTRMDATSGAVKGHADVGPIAAELTETGDGRIAIVSGGDNKLRLVNLKDMSVTVGYTFGSQTSTLQDVRARDNFLFTAASGSNTVQKLDLAAQGGPKLVAEANVGQGAAPWNVLPLDDDQILVSDQSANNLVSVSSTCGAGRICWTTAK